MTPEAAVFALVADATGLKVYADGHAPVTAEWPFATATVPAGCLGAEVAATVDLWYRDAGEAAPNEAARRLSSAIGRGGRLVAFDGGAAWVRRGDPWCTPMTDTDDEVERRHINITIEYLTQD